MNHKQKSKIFQKNQNWETFWGNIFQILDHDHFIDIFIKTLLPVVDQT